MKTIYLVRHGESEINVSHAFMDDAPPPLTELGKEQSRYLAKRAKKLTFDVIIASPFERTKQTAEMIVKETGHPIEYSELFTERTMPTSLVGKSRSDPDAKKLYDTAVRSSCEPGSEKVEGTETFEEMKERAGQALRFLEQRSEEDILVVGHGFFTKMLIARMLYGENMTAHDFAPFEWGWRTRNTGISVLKYEPSDPHRSWWLLVWNDHAHLG